MNTAGITNRHAIVRLLRRPAPAPKTCVWNPHSEHGTARETQLRMRAQSILSGPLIGQCPPLTVDQARDVLNWHRPQYATR